jgi:hypothetical protein
MAREQTRQRIPTPPTTRAQEEQFAAEQEERQGDPVGDARKALAAARRALSDAEDALDRV